MNKNIKMRSSQTTKYNIQQYFLAYIKHNEFLHFHQLFRSGIDNSACGDAIKILHSRERSFCNIFAEMHIEIYIPPRGNTNQNRQFRLRECNQNFTFPQAEIL